MRRRYYRKATKQEVSEMHRAKALEAELREATQKTYARRFIIGVLLIAPILGYFFHRNGVVLGVIAFPVFIIWMIFALIKRNGDAREVGLYLLLTLLFFIFSIVGDLNNPPSALCMDNTYSYSANNRGTCSWHGGVAKWGPPIWWERFLD